MRIEICPNCGAKNRIDERAIATRQPVCGRCRTPLRVSTNSGDGGSGAASAGHPIEVTDASIGQLLQQAGDRPVLVDCWAAWCGPCRMLAPTIDALARESNGRWLIAKLDTDANPATATRFRINSIPALLIFKNGQLVDQLVGAQPKHAIAARLDHHM